MLDLSMTLISLSKFYLASGLADCFLATDGLPGESHTLENLTPPKSKQAKPTTLAISLEAEHQYSLSDEETSTEGTLLDHDSTETPKDNIVHAKYHSAASDLSEDEMVDSSSPQAMYGEASDIGFPNEEEPLVEDEDTCASIPAISSVDQDLGQDSLAARLRQNMFTSQHHNNHRTRLFSTEETAKVAAIQCSPVDIERRAKERKKALESQVSNARGSLKEPPEDYINYQTLEHSGGRSPTPDRGRSVYKITERSLETQLKQIPCQTNSRSDSQVVARRERSKSLTFGMQSPVDRATQTYQKHRAQINGTRPPPHDHISAHSPRAVAWAYRTNQDTDDILRDVKIRLFPKPRTYYEPLELRCTKLHGTDVIAPAFVEQNHVLNPETPRITFDGQFVRIVPHGEPWDDMRSCVDHPDFLPRFKLAEYQACEVAGYPIWRHDRDCFKCAKPDCQRMTSDYNLDTRICAGCGPKSQIRYCSHQHELDDLNNHWKSCGDSQLVMPRIIDHSTAPAYIGNLCPAIKERNGIRSFELFRQRHFSIHSQGHYTLFDLATRSPITLMWPKSDRNWIDMDGRIERLLNIAFLDSQSLRVLRYLYILLRHLISITPLNSEQSLQRLKMQLGAEFGTQIFRSTDDDPIFPCDCEWFGLALSEDLHLPSCPRRGIRYRSSPEGIEGLRQIAHNMEDKFWILRAWTQQYPGVRSWRKRVENPRYRHKDVKLGPGFIGWGAELDNSCE